MSSIRRVFVCEMRFEDDWNPGGPAFVNKEDAEDWLRGERMAHATGAEFRVRRFVPAKPPQKKRRKAGR
jgi:hypothetical protein